MANVISKRETKTIETTVTETYLPQPETPASVDLAAPAQDISKPEERAASTKAALSNADEITQATKNSLATSSDDHEVDGLTADDTAPAACEGRDANGRTRKGFRNVAGKACPVPVVHTKKRVRA